MLKILEMLYYIIGFALVDVLLNLVQGNDINILFSLGFSVFFTCVFYVLMLVWNLITSRYQKKGR